MTDTNNLKYKGTKTTPWKYYKAKGIYFFLISLLLFSFSIKILSKENKVELYEKELGLDNYWDIPQENIIKIIKNSLDPVSSIASNYGLRIKSDGYINGGVITPILPAVFWGNLKDVEVSDDLLKGWAD